MFECVCVLESVWCVCVCVYNYTVVMLKDDSSEHEGLLQCWTEGRS